MGLQEVEREVPDADDRRPQQPSMLVSVLLEFAQDHEAVQARLARMQLADRPDKPAAGFHRTLTAWRLSTKFYTYRDGGEFGRTLEVPM